MHLIDSPFFQEMMDSLSVGVDIWDSGGICRYANRACLKFHGVKDVADFVGRHVGELFVSADTGILKALKTKKESVAPSLSHDGIKGICSRVPILDDGNATVCVFSETLATNISTDHLEKMIGTIRELAKKVDYYQHRAHKATGHLHTFDTIVSRSAVMAQLKKIGKKYAKTDNPVLINGESGTGKELLAQAIHAASPRERKPFIVVNCAALPSSLIESELFGYADGAFTGSKRAGMKGKFEAAHTGTIFLDEVGELPLDMQAKLLRVLESGEIQKIGQTTPTYSNFRLLAATNKNIPQMIRDGTFREDLYHRLSILELTLPPLRQRREDTPLLVSVLIKQILGSAHAGDIRLSPSCMKVFMTAEWKGNIREMKNILTAALCSLDEGEKVLKVSHLPPRFLAALPTGKSGAAQKRSIRNTLQETTTQLERETILAALARNGGNCSKTARELGISRTKLYKKFKFYNIK